MVMSLPSFKSSLGTNDYLVQQDPAAEKKKKIFMITGIVVLLIALSVVLLAKKPTPGQTELQAAMQPTSEALGIVDEYDRSLHYDPTKNDVALTQTLLRGNYQELNKLYTTFKPKKRFAGNPKPDKESIATLDQAVRNNTIDNTIIDVLKPKIAKAKKNLQIAKPFFTKKSSLDTIQTSIDDMNSIEDLLNRAR